MRCVLVCLSILLISINVTAQSQKAKEKFATEVFNDFKKNRQDKITNRFIDSVFLDEMITASLKLEEEVTKVNSREEIHEQHSQIAKRFSRSLEQAYIKFTAKNIEGKLRSVEPTIEIYNIQNEPIKAFGIKYKFDLGELEAELKIDKIVYDEKRERFVIMSVQARSYLGTGELWIAKSKEIDLDDEPVVTVPDPSSDLRRQPIPIGSEDLAPPPKLEVFEFVEEMPEFPGGNDSMMWFITKNINYPEIAKELNVQGRVYARFVVSRDGNIEDIKIIKGIGYGCDEAAIRVINKMPKWKPGMQRGKSVPVSFTLPFSFKLK